MLGNLQAEPEYQAAAPARVDRGTMGATPMNLHRLDLTSLSLFTLVVRTGSISQGAALAHLATSAPRASAYHRSRGRCRASRCWRRHSRGVRPTAAGQVLFERARSVLNEVEHLAADLSRLRPRASSGGDPALGQHLRTDAVPARRARRLPGRQPGHPPGLEEQNSSDVVMAVPRRPRRPRHLRRPYRGPWPSTCSTTAGDRPGAGGAQRPPAAAPQGSAVRRRGGHRLRLPVQRHLAVAPPARGDRSLLWAGGCACASRCAASTRCA